MFTILRDQGADWQYLQQKQQKVLELQSYDL